MTVLQEHVAEKAGVSVATVSRVFSGKAGFSKETRNKVLETAQKLGFTPNSFASALRSGKSNNIGVAIREFKYITGNYFGSIISGIAQLSDENNKGLMFATSVSSGVKEAEYIRIAKERRVDGLIVIDQSIKKTELLKLSKPGVPIVLVDRKDSTGRLPSVCVDYSRAVREAVSSLIKLGHKRIAGLTPERKDTFDEYKDKVSGYVDALEEYNLPFCQELLYYFALPDWNCHYRFGPDVLP